MAKFSKHATPEYRKAVIISQIKRLSESERKDYVKNMWPEDRKLFPVRWNYNKL